jgi:uncharacterized membrane protein
VPYFREIVELVGLAVDGAGVLIIVVGILVASVRFALPAARKASDAYRMYRQDVGKAILLGLELLVASDIIRTVAISPTLQSVLVLGLIVLIRTFLSMALEVELEGRFPWQERAADRRRETVEAREEAAGGVSIQDR